MPKRVRSRHRGFPTWPSLVSRGALALALLCLAQGAAQEQGGGGASAPAADGEPYWWPDGSKALVPLCLAGRMTNQVLCLRSYFNLAQILNRVLVVPTWNVAVKWEAADVAYKYRWDTVVDWDRMRKCLEPKHGPAAVMTVPEYLKLRGLKILNVTWYNHYNQERDYAYPPGKGMREFLRLNADELVMPPREACSEMGLRHWHWIPSPRQLREAVEGATRDDAICLGEGFNYRTEPPPAVPNTVTEECRNLWLPHPAIMEFVNGLNEYLFHHKYAAVHLRREDFYEFISEHGQKRGQELSKAGYLPIAQAADHMRETLKEMGITRLFIASNARRMELQLYKTIVKERINGSAIETAVALRDILEWKEWLHEQKWAEAVLSLDHAFMGEGVVWALTDKFLCVKSTEFFKSRWSTFSAEVVELHRNFTNNMTYVYSLMKPYYFESPPPPAKAITF